MTGDLDLVRKDDPFLTQYQPSDLRDALEFLTTWLPFLSKDLCHKCTQILSDRIRSLDLELDGEKEDYIRFMNVKRKKDYFCYERSKGKTLNVLEGLELHSGVFSAAEQKIIVEEVYALEEKGHRGELKEQTYSAPKKWMRGNGRVTIQFGCCYNYATDKMGNPPGILQKETIDPLPSLFKVMIRRLVRWHVLPPTCVPDSCIVNIYEEGDCIPPHIDNQDFVRPFCTVSFLSDCNIIFGSNLKILNAGEFAGAIAIPLPVGSVLVLNGNGADVAKHCVPAVPTKRISITFRKMDESKRPIWFVPEPDLQGIQPLSYETDKERRFDSSNSDDRTRRQPFRRHSTQSEPHYSTRTRQGPIHKRRFRMNPDS
ncbi:2-oxoglutarate and Fe(II)-dependent oxygenase superfamily protein isoform 1 [Tripterygium wilfordii]|uniref:2-oxoglutarate and Fe(II)-dependent oxygenase superfamily protein isoform 1 n=1 Tax=Tripterygium wilfordii TaxID=458696 RepID=A0A7J7DGM7_TRIWF|nr:RNA demethylase ALKBH9B-like [Tripterygium wilfordii]KAF5745507.1 2-oxoglutarate and Fe(II)-dependent oxygenase superfamily protein isoform 1 [Tripterygium wilfordii]